MKFIIERKNLLKPLQQVSNAFGGRPTLPILSNLLLQVKKNRLLLTGTDLEIEIVAQTTLSGDHELGATTIPARKFFDICRSLPDGTEIITMLKNERVLIRSGRSSYSLSTLPVTDFPNLEDWKKEAEFTLSQLNLKQLIESTQFSMAHQDVRYYLNGMLFETEEKELRTIATDGHRLAVCSVSLCKSLPYQSVIVPRKGVIELMRILNTSENLVKLEVGKNNIRTNIGNCIFTSKLIDGRFPDFRRVLLKKPNKILQAKCDVLKQAFSRVAILSNEKLRGIRLYLSTNRLKITANNPAQEKAEEILDVSYQGDDMEIGFNVNYVLDVLNILKCKEVRILLRDEVSCMQIEDSSNPAAKYVIMPMRL